MTLGISQLWVFLALAGALQLYLLWRMLAGSGFAWPRTERANTEPVAADRAAPPARVSRTPSATFGKRAVQP